MTDRLINNEEKKELTVFQKILIETENYKITRIYLGKHEQHNLLSDKEARPYLNYDKNEWYFFGQPIYVVCVYNHFYLVKE